ncbi:hypothetical protein CJP33_26885, partial [Klebsiella pneumoniae]
QRAAGEKRSAPQLPIDPLYITDFNRVRLEFVGHYRDVCENPAKEQLGKKDPRRSCRLTRCTSPTSTAYGWSLSA